MARSVINIYGGALLITFLINSMHGLLGWMRDVGELLRLGQGVLPVLKACPPPCQIHPQPWSSSSQPNFSPRGSSLPEWGFQLHDGSSHHPSATQGMVPSSTVARTQGSPMSLPVPSSPCRQHEPSPCG